MPKLRHIEPGTRIEWITGLNRRHHGIVVGRVGAKKMQLLAVVDPWNECWEVHAPGAIIVGGAPVALQAIEKMRERFYWHYQHGKLLVPMAGMSF